MEEQNDIQTKRHLRRRKQKEMLCLFAEELRELLLPGVSRERNIDLETRKAAEHGDAAAQFCMGYRCENGEGVPKDEAEAVKWYRIAAEQGNARAQFCMGYCYELGQGVPKDEAEAVKWYRKANAERGLSLYCDDLESDEYMMRLMCPPPDVCSRCGENCFSFVSISPNWIAAKWTCNYCGYTALCRADSKENQGDSRSGRVAISKEVLREVWQRDRGQCIECGSKENLEYDHIIPVSRGGANTVRNLQILCESCNRKKSNKSPGDF